MSSFYLIRHGQAGIRTDYDTLSTLGREQSRRLGESFAAQGIEFTAAISGTLNRQQETASAVAAAYSRNGPGFPEIVDDPGWNEFDLDGVYRDIAPALAAADAKFSAEWEEMQAHLADAGHAIHRRWSNCDLTVIRAWVEGRIPSRAESWSEFQERIAGAWSRLAAGEASHNIAVFTSATPIAVAVATVLGVDARTRFRLAGALYNSAYAVVRAKGGDASLVSFNNVPHLNEADLRTLR